MSKPDYLSRLHSHFSSMTGRGRPQKSTAANTNTKRTGGPAKAKAGNVAAPQQKKAEAKKVKERLKPKKRQEKQPDRAEGKSCLQREDKPHAAAKDLETTTKTDCAPKAAPAKTADEREETPVYPPGASAPGKKANRVRKRPEKTVAKPRAEKCAEKIKHVDFQSEINAPAIPEVTEEGARQNPEKAPTPKEETEVGKLLKKTLTCVKMKAKEISNASKVVNKITTEIVQYLKEKSQYFKDVQEPVRTGSYYEKLKISNPDEFDIMIPIPIKRVDVTPYGPKGAFYSVRFKRGENKFKDFLENNVLSATKLLDTFRNDIKKCIKPFAEWHMLRKKPGCPAVTLETEIDSHVISLDVVFCLFNQSSWPNFTTGGMDINKWLGTKVRRDLRWLGYFLVPKFEGKGVMKIDGVLNKDVWRISFSHVEKEILCNHGSEKTCCEKDGERCCRKDCLKLLKVLLQLLKEEQPNLKKICSYHAKTALLHACSSAAQDSDWRSSDLSQCFQRLLEIFEDSLEQGKLPNFFIPEQNLLALVPEKERSQIPRSIRSERESGYPIFLKLSA